MDNGEDDGRAVQNFEHDQVSIAMEKDTPNLAARSICLQFRVASWRTLDRIERSSKVPFESTTKPFALTRQIVGRFRRLLDGAPSQAWQAHFVEAARSMAT